MKRLILALAFLVFAPFSASAETVTVKCLFNMEVVTFPADATFPNDRERKVYSEIHETEVYVISYLPHDNYLMWGAVRFEMENFRRAGQWGVPRDENIIFSKLWNRERKQTIMLNHKTGKIFSKTNDIRKIGGREEIKTGNCKEM